MTKLRNDRGVVVAQARAGGSDVLRVAVVHAGRSRDGVWKIAALACAVACGAFSSGCPAPDPGPTDAPYCELTWGRADVGSEPTVLFVVDRSTSMTEERAALARALPAFVRILTTGDRTLDGPTDDDFVPVDGLHIGILSADLGTAGYPQVGCTEGSSLGDDALLVTTGDATRSGCAAEYPRALSLGTLDAAGADALSTALDCVLTAMPTNDCGSSQPLDAARRSTSLSGMFLGGGGGQLELNGIQDSQLTIIVVSDADDCSVRAGAGALFDAASATVVGPRATRCIDYPELLTTLDRYLSPGRPGAAHPRFAFLAGIPTELLPAGLDPPDYAALLDDPRMTPRSELGPAGEPRIAPSCSSALGDSEPPRRLVELARALGDRAVLGSICDGELATDLSRVAMEIGDRPDCLTPDIPSSRDADGYVGCELLIRLAPPGTVAGWPATCAELPGADPTPYRTDQFGFSECRLRQLPVVDDIVGVNPTSGERRGWYLDDLSEFTRHECERFDHPAVFARAGLADLPRYTWPARRIECCGSRR